MIKAYFRGYSVSRIVGNQNKLGIIAIIAFCVVCRGSHITWDDLLQTHPDERYINLVATSIEFFGTSSDANDSESRLNPFYWPDTKTTRGIEIPRGEPRLFAYGHAPLYLRVAVAKGLSFVGKFLGTIDDYVLRHLFLSGDSLEILQMVVVGRYLSVLADCITLLIVYFIAKKLEGQLVGLISAGLFAASVQFIQQAHYGTFDSLLTTAVTAVLWVLVLYLESGKVRYLNIAGGAIGLAVGIKATALLLVIPAFTAILCYEFVRAEDVKLRVVRKILELLIVPGLYALVVFIVCNPYAVIEWKEYLSNIALQSYMVRGLVDWPFILQYKNTTPYIYHIIEQGRWTIGWPLTIFMYAGTTVLGKQVISRFPLKKTGYDVAQRLVLLIWVLSYFMLIGGLYVKYPRYMLPIIPIQIIFAAILLVRILKVSITYGLPVILVVVSTTAVYAIEYVRMYDQPHPWIVASNWMYRNVDIGDTVLIEKWDHPLPMPQVRQLDKLVFIEGFDTVALNLAELPDTEQKFAPIVEDIVQADYIIVASNRNYGPVYGNSELFPYSVKYYQGLFDGTLGYSLELAETRHPSFFGISLRGDPIGSAGINLRDDKKHYDHMHRSVVADESFTVYDHPLVLVFYNESKLGYDHMMDVIVGKQ
ncbi:MAG TPA: hypothetical protein DGN60_03985 [Chloroflexi bacterium]|nr:hypothetical protein [Chloroflexota bacterium]